MEKLSEILKPGDLITYPSVKGLALTGVVIGLSKEDVIVNIDGDEHYIARDSINTHGILRSKLLSGEILEVLQDPDMKIVYLRMTYNETFWDKLYNFYCRLKGRTNPIRISENRF